MIRNNEKQSIIKQIGALLLLACYVIVFFQVNLIHHIQHDQSDHHSHVHHDVETESDACHRAIYHPEENDGCSHETHILAVSDICEFCDAVLSQTDVNEELNQFILSEQVDSRPLIFSNQFINLPWSIATPLRGPPALFS